VQTAINDCVTKNQDEILSLNRDQILYGRDAKGGILYPSYDNDPYFNDKSEDYKKSYIEKKNKLEREHNSLIKHKRLYKKKSSDTPNLIITGSWFQNYLFIRVSGNTFETGSSGKAAPDIERKYLPLYGLSRESKEYFWIKYMRKAIMKHLGLKG
jgi:hypothetical protein